MSPDPADRRDAVPGCITCGDVGVPMRVLAVDGDLARCAADAGTAEDVAIDLVGPVGPGDHVLVHAGVAIGRLEERPA